MKNVDHEKRTTWTLCNVKNCNMKRLLYKKVQRGKYAEKVLREKTLIQRNCNIKRVKCKK